MRTAYGAGATTPALDVVVARLAARQHGTFSRRQLAELGVTKGSLQRRLASRRWEQMSRDAFRLSGVPSSVEQTLAIACFTWGDDVAVSHRAASALWKLIGFDRGLIVEITVPLARQRKNRGWVVHRNKLDRIDVTKIGSIPVTTPARTLIDLAAVASRDLVEEALDDALRRELVTIPRLQRRLDAIAGQGGRRGVGAMRHLLKQREGIAIPESRFETRLFRVIRLARLPLPEPQHVIRHRDGRFVARADFAYPYARLAIEADSHRFHTIERDRARDHVRRNALMLLGWRVLIVKWEDLVHEPDRITTAIARALSHD